MIAPVPSARYTEVAGHAVLCDATSRQAHRISPAAASIWGLFDGRRSLAEIAASLGDHDGAPDLPAVVELVRRLRALGLAEDAVGPRPEPVGNGPLERLRFRGRLRDDGGTAVAVLEPAGDGTGTTFEVTVTGSAPSTGHGDLAGVELDEAAATPAEAAYAVFGALVLAITEPDLDEAGVLDVLAELAESLRPVPSSSA